MIPGMHRVCPTCHGTPITLGGPLAWTRCKTCDGLGYNYVEGGPGFGCRILLADRVAGEIVELATGERAQILWQVPRDDPETTFVALFVEDFGDVVRDPRPRPYPAALGVRSVGVPIMKVTDDGRGTKDADAIDPMARRSRSAGILI